MSRVYVTVEEKVSTTLLAFPGDTVEELKAVLGAEGETIARQTRTALGAHGRGRLAGSVKVATRAYRNLSVSTTVTYGGTRTTRHGHLFERGFEGIETVRGHESTSRFGNRFHVREYRRSVVYRPHRSMEGALDSRRSSIRARVLAAVGQTAEKKGLAS